MIILKKIMDGLNCVVKNIYNPVIQKTYNSVIRKEYIQQRNLINNT